MEVRDRSAATIDRREHVLAMVGEFDIFLSAELESQINDCIASTGRVALDLRQCTYVDSTILTVLVRAVNKYRTQLEMIGPPGGNVARVLSITKLDRFLPFI